MKWSGYVFLRIISFEWNIFADVSCHDMIIAVESFCNNTKLSSEFQNDKLRKKNCQFQIHLKPIERSTAILSNDRIYKCPVYKTSQRCGLNQADASVDNFIIELKLNCDSNNSAEHWILRGCALICDLDNWWEQLPQNANSYTNNKTIKQTKHINFH